MTGIGYRPEIDGLRALAVIPVILFHVGSDWIPGGYIGVDVFFVISGFLITSIIKKELDSGTFSFRDFWARRVRRILPAMVLMTAITLAMTYAFVFRPDQQAIGEQALASLLSVANMYLWQNTGDYWGWNAEASPFLHAWSLSVEEQFYLFFPIAMWLMSRFRSRWLHASILSAVAVSLALFLWGSQTYPTATFYLLPTRIWELGTGCLLALTFTAKHETDTGGDGRASLGVLGVFMLICSFVFFPKLGSGMTVAVTGTALVIAFGQSGPSNRLLSSGVFVHLGKLSYSLYLWHWPVLVLAEPLGYSWPGFTDKLIAIVATYVLAFITFHLVEKPTRKKKGIVPLILLGTLVVGLAAFRMAWFPRGYDISQFSEARWVPYCSHPEWTKPKGPIWSNVVIENPGYSPDAMSRGGIRIGNKSVVPEVIVLGDSHGAMWSDAIATISKEYDIPTAFFAQCGQEYFINALERNKSSIYKDIIRWKPKLIIVGNAWRRNRDSDAMGLLEFAGAHGSKVLLIEDPPWLPCTDRNAMQWLASQGVFPEDNVKQFLSIRDENSDEGGRRRVRLLAENYNHVQFVATHDLFVSPSGILVLDGKSVTYIDDNHLSSFGAHLAVPRLRKMMLEILETPY